MIGKRRELTCDDCYFRRAGLCALALEAPCPTFRPKTRGSLSRPAHASLVARPISHLPEQHAAA